MKKPEKCFVVMPFSETTHGNRVVTSKEQWDHIYEKWIKRAIDAYRRTKVRAERSAAVPGSFIRGIVSDLAESFLVVADVTGSKPNVFYEVGIRHALRTGTILITQDLGSLPSDLRGYYAFQYTYSDKAHEYDTHYARFEKELHEKVDAFIDGKVTSDSPVSDFLGFRKEVYDKQLEAEKAKLKRLIVECGKSMADNFHVCEFLLAAFTKGKEIPLKNWPIIDVGPIDALYATLLSIDLDFLGSKPLDALRKIVSGHRKALLMTKHHWETFFLLPSDEGANSLVHMLEYFVKGQKPVFTAKWDSIVDAVDDIKVQLVITEKGKRRVLNESRNTG